MSQGTNGEQAVPDAVLRSMEDFARPLDEALARHARAVDTVQDGIRRAAEEAAATHARLLADLELSGDDPVAPPGVVRTYVARCADEVLDPLGIRLAELDAAASLRAAWTGLRDSGRRLAGAVPARTWRAEPPDLYRARAEDPPGVRWIKMRMRMARRLRGLGTSRRPPIQSVPGRELALHHVAVRLPRALQPRLAEVVARVGAWVHTLERGSRRWWDALAWPVDCRLDRVESDEQGPLSRAVRALDACLEAVGSTDPAGFASASADDLAQARAALESDFARGGTPLLPLRTRSVKDRGSWSWEGGAGGRFRWDEWHREAARRLRLEVAMAHLRDAMWRVGRELTEGIRRVLEEVAAKATDEAEALRAEAEEIEAHPGGGIRDATGAILLDRGREARERLEKGLLAALRDLAAGGAAPRSQADRQAEAILALLQRQPETFSVHPLVDGDAPVPESAGIDFEFRRAAAQCFDAFLVERFRGTVAPVLEELGKARARAEEIPGIVTAGFSALEDEVEEGAPVEGDVVDMGPEALRRAADACVEVARLVVAGLEPLDAAVGDVLQTGWARLSQRTVLASGVSEQLAGLQSRLRARAVESVEALRTWVHDRYRALVRGWRDADRRFQSLLTWARPAEGGTASGAQALDLLARLGSVAEGLPLVYQRLFTLQPLRNPDMLVGRSEVITRILAAAAVGAGRRSLLLVCQPGAGLSSTFRAVEATGVADRVRRIVLEERLFTGGELAGALARGAGLAPVTALAELPAALAAGCGAPPVVLVEGLEHAFMRTPGGTDAVERLLALVADSSDPVVWVLAVCAPAWQVIEKIAPQAAAGLDVMRLDLLDRAELEEALLLRHMRSGIPLEFAAPADPNPLLKRRLRRARSPESRTALLRQEYFDRLHRTCGGSLPLALVLWLDGIELDRDSGGARVCFPRTLSSSFLDGLGLEEAFALKAFLEHGTLTVMELARVIRVPEAAAERMVDGLTGLRVLAPADGAREAPPTATMRLQVAPVALPLVSRFLKGRNVLH